MNEWNEEYIIYYNVMYIMIIINILYIYIYKCVNIRKIILKKK